jgi:hypothetical protein
VRVKKGGILYPPFIISWFRAVTGGSMAFLAFLRSLVPGYMAVHAEAVQGLVSVIALVACGALLFAFRVVLHMVTINAFQALILVYLVRHADGTDMALIYAFTGLCRFKSSGNLGNGYNIGRGISGLPGIIFAGSDEYNDSNYRGDRNNLIQFHLTPPFWQQKL